MEGLQVPHLLDEHGQPLSSRIEEVLRFFIPKLRREFRSLRDEQEFVEILERAGQKVARREQRKGLLKKLHPYTWVTIKTVARSWMRLASNQVPLKLVAPEEAHTLLATAAAREGSPEEIEQAVLIREAINRLKPNEQVACLMKMQGHSSEEIAKRLGTSTAAADMVFSRAKRKLYRFLTGTNSVPRQERPAARCGARGTGLLNSAVLKKSDGEPTPGT
jgi:DNA-directed RNA polymerase specialized sigma24 family protein